MDATTLAYHTKLHQWYELHRLNRGQVKGGQCLPADRPRLTPQRAIEIDQWRREVNKIFIKPKRAEKKELFWRVHASAPGSATKHGASHTDPRRVKSARFFSSRTSKPSLVDMDALPSHLAEMSIHYSRERTGVYSPRFSPEELIVKGNKQALNTPQGLQSVKGQAPEIGTAARRDGTCVSIPQGEEEYDVITHAGSSHRYGGQKKALVTDRSPSNVLLNVISIDDCKMALRYRPQRVITTREMVLHESPNNGETSDTDLCETVPLRVSESSRATPTQRGRTRSILSAQRDGHRQLAVPGTNAHAPRPQSAVLTRAFDTLLQDKSLLWQPAHPKEVRFLSNSRAHGLQGRPLYNRMNSLLKNKMHSVVNSRGENMKSRESGSTSVQYGSNRGGICWSTSVGCNRPSLVA